MSNWRGVCQTCLPDRNGTVFVLIVLSQSWMNEWLQRRWSVRTKSQTDNMTLDQQYYTVWPLILRVHVSLTDPSGAVCLYICVSFYARVFLYVCLSIRESFYACFFLYVCLSIRCVFLCVSLSIRWGRKIFAKIVEFKDLFKKSGLLPQKPSVPSNQPQMIA